MKSIPTLGICAILLAASAPALIAQESSNRVAANTAWSVFVETDPKECWAVSTPAESVNTRDDQPVSVNRGTILMMVSFRPDQNVAGEVYFTGGYPFADGSAVELTISGTSFQLFTQGEDSWPATAADDARIITAMKRGADAVLVANSSRGTRTEDTFSLLGFTAAIEEAATRCGG